MLEFFNFLFTLTGAIVWVCGILLAAAYTFGFVSIEKVEEHDDEKM
jgi:hypothetical protein